MSEEASKNNDLSIVESMLNLFNRIIEEKYQINDKKLKKLIDSIFIWRCKCENIENASRSFTQLSARNFFVWQELKGSQIIELKHGYLNLINLMLKDFKEVFNSKLRTRHSLKQILLCNNKSNCLHCRYTSHASRAVLIIEKSLIGQSSEDLIVTCDLVLLTPSLGYLKENLKRLIQPTNMISIEKLRAVERVGYGTVNKIFLVYDKPFWQSNVSCIHPIWFLKENQTIVKNLEEINEANWFENISYFDVVKNHGNILCAWLSGCEFVEEFSEEKIARDCTLILRKFFDNETIPEPTKVLK